VTFRKKMPLRQENVGKEHKLEELNPKCIKNEFTQKPFIPSSTSMP